MKLDKTEKRLEREIERSEWKPVKASQLKAKLQKAASNTLVKDQRINIRISSKDLQLIKTRAAQEGLPYQTLIASVLHKYISGKLSES